MAIDPKFKDPAKDTSLNEVDWVNFYYDFLKIFDGCESATIVSETEVAFLDPDTLSAEENAKPTFVLLPDGRVSVKKNSPYPFGKGSVISKFMLFAAINFYGDAYSAMSHVAYFIRKKEIPYIRVGTDYLKVIQKDSRFGGSSTILKSWKKEAISDDHGKPLLKIIPRYDDFAIVPNNLRYSQSYKNCYNLYAPFPHAPAQQEVKLEDIPNSSMLLQHIFGAQVELGMRYLKILYEMPTQILPVLCLVSEERETGKTTFLNWMQMIFGENSVQISPQTLTSNFNDGYATKNIVIIDETVVEKSTSIEKLKSLATAKTISVSQKFISHYSVPFYGKIIIATNKEKDFMRIDENEIRFWIRKVPPINGNKNTNIENDLFSEIPKLLKYLQQLEAVDLTKTRMVFTAEEIGTRELNDVKEESKSSLRKELEILIEDHFTKHPSQDFFEATLHDMKAKWFTNNHQVTMSYLKKVLRHEMKMTNEEPKRYNPFGQAEGLTEMGRPYVFNNPHPQKGKDNVVRKENGDWWDPDGKMGDLPF